MKLEFTFPNTTNAPNNNRFLPHFFQLLFIVYRTILRRIASGYWQHR